MNRSLCRHNITILKIIGKIKNYRNATWEFPSKSNYHVFSLKFNSFRDDEC